VAGAHVPVRHGQHHGHQLGQPLPRHRRAEAVALASIKTATACLHVLATLFGAGSVLAVRGHGRPPILEAVVQL